MLLFRFRPDTTEELKSGVLADLRSLPTHYPTMRNFGMGLNESERDTTFTHVLTVEFDAQQQLLDYLNSPFHEDLVTTRFKPAVELRAIASYTVHAV